MPTLTLTNEEVSMLLGWGDHEYEEFGLNSAVEEELFEKIKRLASEE